MAKDARIYKVTQNFIDADSIKKGSVIRLVEAANAAQAIRHVVKESVTCEPCSVADALALGADGYIVEKSGEAAE